MSTVLFKKVMSTPKVSVIVPGHNVADCLQSVLSSLSSQDWPKDRLEIIYVDDASTDSSAEVASKWADRVVRLEGLPHGAARARNAGVLQSSGEILVFIDSDVLASPCTIRDLAGLFMEDEDLDAVFGSYDSKPEDPGLVSQYRNLMHHFVHQTSRKNASTFWAGCGAIRKSSFEKAGGFDAERYKGAMIEDIELGHRLNELGMQIRLQPSIQVKHLKKWTLFQMIRADIFSRGIPWMRLMFRDSKSSGEIGDLNLRLSGILSVALAWAAVLMLILSIWFPAFISGFILAFGFLLALNIPTYLFFWKIRGPFFTLMVVPLNMLYHIYNGVSVVGALLCRCIIDKPLPGLRAISERFQTQYWQYLGLRREKKLSARDRT